MRQLGPEQKKTVVVKEESGRVTMPPSNFKWKVYGQSIGCQSAVESTK